MRIEAINLSLQAVAEEPRLASRAPRMASGLSLSAFALSHWQQGWRLVSPLPLPPLGVTFISSVH